MFAVPGLATSPLSSGCHALIRQGAELITTADQICQALGVEPQSATPVNSVELTPPQRQLIEQLTAGPVSMDELVVANGQSAAQIMVILAPLLARGIVSGGPEGYIARL